MDPNAVAFAILVGFVVVILLWMLGVYLGVISLEG